MPLLKSKLTLVPKEKTMNATNPMDPFGIMDQMQKAMVAFQMSGQNQYAKPKAPAAETVQPFNAMLGFEKILNPLGLPVPDAIKMMMPVAQNPVNQFNFLTSNAQATMLQLVMMQQSMMAACMAMTKLAAPQFPFPQFQH